MKEELSEEKPSFFIACLLTVVLETTQTDENLLERTIECGKAGRMDWTKELQAFHLKIKFLGLTVFGDY